MSCDTGVSNTLWYQTRCTGVLSDSSAGGAAFSSPRGVTGGSARRRPIVASRTAAAAAEEEEEEEEEAGCGSARSRSAGVSVANRVLRVPGGCEAAMLVSSFRLVIGVGGVSSTSGSERRRSPGGRRSAVPHESGVTHTLVRLPSGRRAGGGGVLGITLAG